MKLKKEQLLITAAVIIKLSMQLIATWYSGYHGDELLHIEAGRHPAAGYMDFPPLIGFLAWVQGIFHSDSLYVQHIFNYAGSAITIIVAGLLTIRLGGKLTALAITLVALLFAPGLAASHYLFLPAAFEQPTWLLFTWFAIRYCQEENGRYIRLLAIAAALAFLNKYSALFLLAGFGMAVVLFKRELLFKRYSWLALLLFAVLISPNLYWQYIHGFPVFHHMDTLYKTQLGKQQIGTELLMLVLALNPFTSFFWISGLILVPFSRSFRKYRLISFTLLFAFILFVFSNAKAYYFFPLIPALLPFGAVYAEQLVSRKWILPAILTLVIVFGLITLPMGIPLMPLQSYLTRYQQKPDKNNKIPLVFENYYAGENWPLLLDSTAAVFRRLPVDEQQHCLIWGRHYSMAGGFNLMGKRYNLPSAFSFHSSLYSWVPEFDRTITVIGVSECNLGQRFWEQYFADVQQAAVLDNRYASEKNWYCYRIFICRGLKYNAAELRQLFKTQVF